MDSYCWSVAGRSDLLSEMTGISLLADRFKDIVSLLQLQVNNTGDPGGGTVRLMRLQFIIPLVIKLFERKFISLARDAVPIYDKHKSFFQRLPQVQSGHAR